MDERIQDRLPGVKVEGEVLVRGHVRHVKPKGERKPRVKPYPSKWGRGKSYGFSDGRILLLMREAPLLKRIRFAYLMLRGATVRYDGQLVVIAAHGTKPVVKPATTDSTGGAGDNFLLGPRDERP